MFIDARRLAGGTEVAAEICIIGAGAAGITLARELSGQAFRVCLIESGGFHMRRETQRLYEGETVGIPYDLESTRSRYFGGSTNCWAGFNRPWEEYHFEKRDWVPDSGWPISRKDVEPYYLRAHETSAISADGYDPDVGLAALNGQDLRPLPLANTRLLTRLSQLTTSRRRFGQVYRNELGGAPNITIYLHANTVALEASGDGNRIEGVHVATLAGNRMYVRARFFVLATGGIENARLLLASNAGESGGIGNRYDMVGRYFMETPRIVAADVRLSATAEKVMKAYVPRYAMLRLPVAAEISIRRGIQRAERLLEASAFFELVLKGEEADSTTAFKDVFWDLWRGALPRQPRKQIASVLSSPFDVAVFGLGVLTCARRFIQSRRIQLISEQCPNPESRVMLSHERDRLGVNRVRLDWRLTELDRRSASRTAAILCEDLQRAGVLSVEHTRALDDREPPYWNWHHLGTTRMCDDPKRGVVDRTCRVHGLGNLFIAGSSVFTTGGHQTPTLTIIALAIRLADHLRAMMAAPLLVVAGVSDPRHPVGPEESSATA
jgi:choline dehydrogenase-like flavoprotein